MKSNQVKLLTSLAKDIRSESKDKAKTIATLKSAKILTRQGNFTAKYKNLKRIAASAK